MEMKYKVLIGQNKNLKQLLQIQNFCEGFIFAKLRICEVS